MKDKLKIQLKKYRDITLKLIENLNQNQFDELNDLLSERESVIYAINSLKYTNEEFKELCSDFKIIESEKILLNLMSKRKEFVRNEIEKMTIRRNANKSYNENFYNSNRIFSKKI
jgi:hypothetical protein